MKVKLIKTFQDLFEGTILQEAVEKNGWYRGFWISGCKIIEVDIPKEYCIEV